MKKSGAYQACLLSVGVLGLVLAVNCSSPTSSGSGNTITGVTLNDTAYNLEVGQSNQQLTATVLPSTASQTVAWASTNSAITAVSATGVISAVSAGTTMITATASDGKTSATCGTAVWQADGNGYLRYLSNDTAFYNWWFFHSPANQTSLPLATNPVTVTVAKVSGLSSEGYGIVFCEQDSNDYYRLLIASNGQYQVVKYLANVAYTLVPWTVSTAIVQGQGTTVTNVLKVSQPSAGSIAITINSILVNTVSDSAFSGGKTGFWAGNAQTGESFPGTPEDIRFKITSPIAYP